MSNSDPEKTVMPETRDLQSRAAIEPEIESKDSTPPRSYTEKEEIDDEIGYLPSPPTEQAAKDNVLNRVASRISTRSLPEPGPPPDGGLKAWIQCAMTWLVVFNTWGYVNSFGVFQTYYIEIINEPASTISWVGSTQTFVLFFLGVFSGRATDAGYFLPLFAVGSAIQILGIFMTSLASNYWQLFLAQGICTGIGSGMIFTPSMGVLSTYFADKRGLAIALATTGNSAGGALYPLMVQQMLPELGFGWTMRVLGFINLACLTIVLALMRPRLPPRKAGALIDWSALKEVDWILLTLGLASMMTMLYWSNYYIASYGRQTFGLSYSNSVILLIILNGVGIPARVTAGLLADRCFGVLNTFVVLLGITAIMAYCWIGVGSRTSLYVFVCFYGVILAAFQSLLPTAITSFTRNLRMTGTRLGMCFTVFSFAALVGPPIGGALIDGNSYTHAQIWAGTSALIGTALVAAARVYRFGWSLKVKC